MSESKSPDPENTMDKGFMVGAIVGLIVLVTMSSVASCIRGEQTNDNEPGVEQSQLRQMPTDS